MSAVVMIGAALRYDACEALLASGAPLSRVLELAAVQAEAAVDHYDGPASTRPTARPCLPTEPVEVG